MLQTVKGKFSVHHIFMVSAGIEINETIQVPFERWICYSAKIKVVWYSIVSLLEECSNFVAFKDTFHNNLENGTFKHLIICQKV